MNEHPYPEHQKLKAIADKSQAIHDFLEWLQDTKGGFLAVRAGRRQDAYPMRESLRTLLAEFYEIDLDKIEDEKRAMLDECRRLNEAG